MVENKQNLPRNGEGFPLSDTSALVLLWLDDQFYETDAARRYLAGLDLSAGLPLYHSCNEIWPHYCEIIHNRKFAMRHLARQHLRPQIIIGGAGLDAMGLELAALPVEVYELDRTHMEAKQELIGEVCDLKNLHCVSADLAHPAHTITALKTAGWREDVPSLLVLEGVSYYITETELAALVTSLVPERVIVDFLLPADALPPESARIGDGVFGAIAEACGLGGITRYSAQNLAQTMGRTLLEQWSMTRIDTARLGAPHRFTPPFEGWIEIDVLK